jgi:hypothetical protein
MPCVDHLSSEALNNNEFYPYMRKTEKPYNNYNLDKYYHVCSQNFTKDTENIFIYSFIHLTNSGENLDGLTLICPQFYLHLPTLAIARGLRFIIS